jgi:dTDP-4-amino-4,6-dideoxygalactose transaminase
MPLPVSADLAARMLCFPLYSDMEAVEQRRLLERLDAMNDVF